MRAAVSPEQLRAPRLRGEGHTALRKTRSRPGEGALPQSSDSRRGPLTPPSPRKRGEGARGRASLTTSLAPLAGRGPHGTGENPISARRGGVSAKLRLAAAPPHPTLSPQAGRGRERPRLQDL